MPVGPTSELHSPTLAFPLLSSTGSWVVLLLSPTIFSSMKQPRGSFMRIEVLRRDALSPRCSFSSLWKDLEGLLKKEERCYHLRKISNFEHQFFFQKSGVSLGLVFPCCLESKLLNKSLVGMSKEVNSLFLYIISLISHIKIICRNLFQSSYVLRKNPV